MGEGRLKKSPMLTQSNKLESQGECEARIRVHSDFSPSFKTT